VASGNVIEPDDDRMLQSPAASGGGFRNGWRCVRLAVIRVPRAAAAGAVIDAAAWPWSLSLSFRNAIMSDDFGQPQKTSSSSTAFKVILILGCIVGVLCLACCGGMFWFGKQFANAMTQDPVRIREIATAILDFPIPEEFEPQVGMTPPMEQFGFQMAMFGRGQLPDQSGMLMLMEIPGPFQAGQMDIGEHMRQNQQGQHQKHVTIEKSEKLKVEINGSVVSVEVGSGTDEEGTEVRQVVGGFPTRSGKTGMLIMQVQADKMSEEQARAFVGLLGVVSPDAKAADGDPPAGAPDAGAPVDGSGTEAPANGTDTEASPSAPDSPDDSTASPDSSTETPNQQQEQS